MKNLITVSAILVLSLFCNGLSAKEDDLGNMIGVHKAIENVVQECSSAAQTFAINLMIKIRSVNPEMKITEEDKRKMTEEDKKTFIKLYDDQVRLCLEIAAFKIKEAAATVK
jgi:hypothetical protein